MSRMTSTVTTLNLGDQDRPTVFVVDDDISTREELLRYSVSATSYSKTSGQALLRTVGRRDKHHGRLCNKTRPLPNFCPCPHRSRAVGETARY